MTFATDSGATLTSADPRLWTDFATARGMGEFCRSWLALLCARTAGAVAGLVLLETDNQRFAPAAVWPDGPHDFPHLKQVAEKALSTAEAVIEADPANPRLMGIAYPLVHEQRSHGAVVLAVEGQGAAAIRATMRELHWGAGWLDSILWQHRAGARMTAARAASVAMDVLAAAQEADLLEQSLLALSNALALALKADRVAIGLVRRGSVKLAAISHGAWFRKRSDVAEALEGAMDEALDQGMALTLPAIATEGNPITLQQAQELTASGQQAIATIPIVDRHLPIGAFVLERGDKSAAFEASEIRIVEAVAALVAPTIALKQREQRFFSGRSRHYLMETAKALFGPRRPVAKTLGVAAVVLLLVLLAPVAQFRVKADASLEGRMQRAAAAPFAGFIADARSQAGDVVQAGDVLAVLDDRDLKVDRARAIGEVQQLDRRYRDALAKHERAEMNLAGAQLRQAEASLRLIEYRLSRTAIIAPLSGVVVSGDLSQRIGAPVEEGETLFEVAPLDDYRIALDVPDADINYLSVGQRGRFAPTGLAGRTVPLVIARITSVTANVDGRNVFRVEAELDNSTHLALRPGMEGIAKVDIDRRANLWIWTRTLRSWLTLFLWKWLP